MAQSALSEPEFVKKACVKLGGVMARSRLARSKARGGNLQIGGVVEHAELVDFGLQWPALTVITGPPCRPELCVRPCL